MTTILSSSTTVAKSGFLQSKLLPLFLALLMLAAFILIFAFIIKTIKDRNKKELYLSDKPPLTYWGTVALITTYAILIFWAFIVLWPISQMVISAFNGNQAIYVSVGFNNYEFSFKHFKFLFEETGFVNWVINTLFISISTALLTVVLVSFTGYVYSRFRFKGRKATLMSIMLIQTIPIFAGITAFFTLYELVNDLIPIFSKHMMLILIYSAGGIAGNTFILKGYLDSISTELDDAGRMDGCSNMEIYRLIIMPIAKPMLAIIALWSFIGPFMDFLLPRILLSDTKALTLASGLYTLVVDDRSFNQPAFVAGALLIAVPIVFMFIYLQKYLVSGLSKGSVKG
ncbi:MAG TPA: sugar ABC transporter permease [Clostridia bacterium]|nr:sugar ABC transporter permease [Clostridia bacterium]HPQ47139.1 sugar ABC transporter permease [Clostridia bacterium]HRX42800.1 sugar ABC transporter permease [Clostridia bacterium]